MGVYPGSGGVRESTGDGVGTWTGGTEYIVVRVDRRECQGVCLYCVGCTCVGCDVCVSSTQGSGWGLVSHRELGEDPSVRPRGWWTSGVFLRCLRSPPLGSRPVMIWGFVSRSWPLPGTSSSDPPRGRRGFFPVRTWAWQICPGPLRFRGGSEWPVCRPYECRKLPNHSTRPPKTREGSFDLVAPRDE